MSWSSRLFHLEACRPADLLTSCGLLPPLAAAAYLLVSLIPSNSFRQMFRSTRSLHLPTRELPLSPDTTVVLHQVYNLLLGLLGRAKLYVDASVHGTTKLVQYFSFMTYCLISKTEKLMFSGYFMDLWNLFQVGLCSPHSPCPHQEAYEKKRRSEQIA